MIVSEGSPRVSCSDLELCPPDRREQEHPVPEYASSGHAKSGGTGVDRARIGNSAAGRLAAPNQAALLRQEPRSDCLAPNLALPTCERCGTRLTRLCGGLGLFTCTHCGRRRSRQQALCASCPATTLCQYLEMRFFLAMCCLHGDACPTCSYVKKVPIFCNTPRSDQVPTRCQSV